MSRASPTARHDATLSKTLIDAKHRLGAVYFEARLIECPKNAIELKKLLKNYDKLEKEYVKDVSNIKRNQQMLSLSLTNYLKSDKSAGSQEMLGQSRAEALSMPPPPGFRFRSNGEPKQLQLKSTSEPLDGRLCWQPSYLWQKPPTSSLLLHSHRSETETPYGTETESLHGITTEESKPDTGGQKKYTESCCNARFAFKPGSINFGKSDGKILRLRKSIRSSLRPACSSCQFKLKYSDEALQRMQQYQKEPLIRWQIAPKGRYVKAPFSYSELEKMVSDVHFSNTPSSRAAGSSGQTIPNSLDAITEANLPEHLSETLKLSSTDNRRLASSAALTSVLRHSLPDKHTYLLEEKPSPPLHKHFSPLFEDKPSCVSFSPSVIGLHSSCDSDNHYERKTSSQHTNDIPYRRKYSVNHWRPILEEERLQCVMKVDKFLESLPGEYIPRLKSKEEGLLPWARCKLHRTPVS